MKKYADYRNLLKSPIYCWRSHIFYVKSKKKIVNLVWSGMTYGVKLLEINDILHKVRKYLGIKLNFYFYVNERKSKDITLKVRHMFRVQMSITLFWLIEGHNVTIYALSLSKNEFTWNCLRITRSYSNF